MLYIIAIVIVGMLIRTMLSPLVWWSQVKTFKTTGPSQDCIVFTGSSSIGLWDSLAKDMAPLPVVNRGFGGSQMPHLAYFVDYIFSGCNPQAIVVYSGENDFAIRRFMTPARVLRNFRKFVDLVQNRFPGKPIYVISIKLAPSREIKWNKFIKTNILLQQFAQERPGVTFIETNTALDRHPNKNELYSPDSLHFSPQGYAIWTSVIRPILLKASS